MENNVKILQKNKNKTNIQLANHISEYINTKN